MHEQQTFKFIFKSKTFSIPDSFSLKNINQTIYSSLIETNKYEVQSNVSEETFQSFIKYLVKKDIPYIVPENISEYEMISQEFDSMKNIIQIYKMHSSKNKINQELFKNEDLKSLYTKKINEKNEKIRKNQQIIDILFNNEGIDSIERFYAVKDELYNCAKNEDIEMVDLLTQKKVKIGNFTFTLNERNKTAGLFSEFISKVQTFMWCDSDVLNIPRSITYNSQEYIVTEICKSCFKENDICFKIVFPDDSQLQKIGKLAFSENQITNITIPRSVKMIDERAFFYCRRLKTIEFQDNSELETIRFYAFAKTAFESITIPSSVINLEDGWRGLASNLKTVNLSPGNKRYKYYNNDFIIGKSDMQNDNYDVLVYVRSDIEKVIIPPFIKTIQKGAFECCLNIKDIVVTDDSQLEYIDNLAYSNISIEKITIHSSTVYFKEGWCRNITKLNEFIVSPKNKNFLFLNDSFLIGKSNLKSESYNTLLYVSRNITDVIIPSMIKIIAPYALQFCSQIQHIQFGADSELQTIETSAFQSSSIREITLPSHVRFVGKYAFGFCKELVSFDLLDDTELKIIEFEAFAFSAVERITIPSDIWKIRNLGNANNLTAIKIIPRQVNNFMFFQNKYLLQKTDPQSDNFDYLAFARRDIKIAKIPSFIKTIGLMAFSDCRQIRKVIFEENSQLETIENSAFFQAALHSIFIPPSVTRIGSYSFFNCKNLRYVNLPNNSKLRAIEMFSFFLSSIKQINIPQSVQYISKMAFKMCKKLQKAVILNNANLKYIGFLAFQGSTIQSILFPSHVLEVDESAFIDCDKLSFIEVDENCGIRDFGFIACMKKYNGLYGCDLMFYPNFKNKLE